MGSSMTCKLNPCCGDRLNCNPPEQYDAPKARKAPGTAAQKSRIATLPEALRVQLIALDAATILAVHDLMHVEMERRAVIATEIQPNV